MRTASLDIKHNSHLNSNKKYRKNKLTNIDLNNNLNNEIADEYRLKYERSNQDMLKLFIKGDNKKTKSNTYNHILVAYESATENKKKNKFLFSNKNQQQLNFKVRPISSCLSTNFPTISHSKKTTIEVINNSNDIAMKANHSNLNKLDKLDKIKKLKDLKNRITSAFTGGDKQDKNNINKNNLNSNNIRNKSNKQVKIYHNKSNLNQSSSSKKIKLSNYNLNKDSKRDKENDSSIEKTRKNNKYKVSNLLHQLKEKNEMLSHLQHHNFKIRLSNNDNSLDKDLFINNNINENERAPISKESDRVDLDKIYTQDLMDKNIIDEKDILNSNNETLISYKSSINNKNSKNNNSSGVTSKKSSLSKNCKNSGSVNRHINKESNNIISNSNRNNFVYRNLIVDKSKIFDLTTRLSLSKTTQRVIDEAVLNRRTKGPVFIEPENLFNKILKKKKHQSNHNSSNYNKNYNFVKNDTFSQMTLDERLFSSNRKSDSSFSNTLNNNSFSIEKDKEDTLSKIKSNKTKINKKMSKNISKTSNAYDKNPNMIGRNSTFKIKNFDQAIEYRDLIYNSSNKNINSNLKASSISEDKELKHIKSIDRSKKVSYNKNNNNTVNLNSISNLMLQSTNINCQSSTLESNFNLNKSEDNNQRNKVSTESDIKQENKALSNNIIKTNVINNSILKSFLNNNNTINNSRASINSNNKNISFSKDLSINNSNDNKNNSLKHKKLNRSNSYCSNNKSNSLENKIYLVSEKTSNDNITNKSNYGIINSNTNNISCNNIRLKNNNKSSILLKKGLSDILNFSPIRENNLKENNKSITDSIRSININKQCNNYRNNIKANSNYKSKSRTELSVRFHIDSLRKEAVTSKKSINDYDSKKNTGSDKKSNSNRTNCKLIDTHSLHDIKSKNKTERKYSSNLNLNNRLSISSKKSFNSRKSVPSLICNEKTTEIVVEKNEFLKKRHKFDILIENEKSKSRKGNILRLDPVSIDITNGAEIKQVKKSRTTRNNDLHMKKTSDRISSAIIKEKHRIFSNNNIFSSNDDLSNINNNDTITNRARVSKFSPFKNKDIIFSNGDKENIDNKDNKENKLKISSMNSIISDLKSSRTNKKHLSLIYNNNKITGISKNQHKDKNDIQKENISSNESESADNLNSLNANENSYQFKDQGETCSSENSKEFYLNGLNFKEVDMDKEKFKVLTVKCYVPNFKKVDAKSIKNKYTTDASMDRRELKTRLNKEIEKRKKLEET